MCEGTCHILSLSGTPIHHPSPSPSSPSPSPHTLHSSHTHTHTHTPSHLHLHHRASPYLPLLKCLVTEQRHAGGFFQQHISTKEDKLYLNCLLFWREVQSYKLLFTGSAFSPCAVEMKAKFLYSHYIVHSSPDNLHCPALLVHTVSHHLWPAYEDLFDEAEEHALRVLLGQWNELCDLDNSQLQQLDLITLSRVSSSVRADEDFESLSEGEEGEGGGVALRVPRRRSPSPLPPVSHATNLDDIMSNPTELEHFKLFLNEHMAALDLMCWMDIEAFRGTSTLEKVVRDLKAKQIRSKYFNKSYFFGPNSPASKEARRQVALAGGGSHLPARPRTPVFIEAQKHVRGRLEKKWLALFIATPEFLERNEGLSRMGSGHRERVMSSRKVKSELLFASSHDAILLRRTLHSGPMKARLQRFLVQQTAEKNHLVEDVGFWLEVQRFKEMCHAHTLQDTLRCKATAIVECYFRSCVPPRLQVDVGHEVADQVAQKKLGPYMFREAQAAVFKHLYTYWMEYQNFISGLPEDQIDSALGRLEVRMARMKKLASENEANNKLKISVPRFETSEERKLRIAKEKELEEFGKVDVAFSLVNPHPECTYYTEMPEGGDHTVVLEDGCREAHSIINFQGIGEETNVPTSSATDGIRAEHTKLPVATSASFSTNEDANNRNYSAVTKGSPHDMIEMKLQGNKGFKRVPRARGDSSSTARNGSNKERSAPVPPPVSKQASSLQLLETSGISSVPKQSPLPPPPPPPSPPPTATRLHTSSSSRRSPGPFSRQVSRSGGVGASSSRDQRMVPHTTLRMRFSSKKNCFAYGEGLPHSSKLTVTATTSF